MFLLLFFWRVWGGVVFVENPFKMVEVFSPHQVFKGEEFPYNVHHVSPESDSFEYVGLKSEKQTHYVSLSTKRLGNSSCLRATKTVIMPEHKDTETLLPVLVFQCQQL